MITAPLRPRPVQDRGRGKQEAGSPDHLEVVLRPVGIGEEEAVHVPRESEVDPQTARRAGLEHRLRVPLPERVEHLVEPLVVPQQPVVRTMAVVGARAAAVGIDVEVELDPLGAHRRDGAAHALEHEGAPRLGAEADIAEEGGVIGVERLRLQVVARIVPAPIDGERDDLGMRAPHLGLRSEGLGLDPDARPQPVRADAGAERPESARKALGVDPRPVAAIVAPVGGRVGGTEPAGIHRRRREAQVGGDRGVLGDDALGDLGILIGPPVVPLEVQPLRRRRTRDPVLPDRRREGGCCRLAIRSRRDHDAGRRHRLPRRKLRREQPRRDARGDARVLGDVDVPVAAPRGRDDQAGARALEADPRAHAVRRATRPALQARVVVGRAALRPELVAPRRAEPERRPAAAVEVRRERVHAGDAHGQFPGVGQPQAELPHLTGADASRRPDGQETRSLEQSGHADGAGSDDHLGVVEPLVAHAIDLEVDESRLAEDDLARPLE